MTPPRLTFFKSTDTRDAAYDADFATAAEAIAAVLWLLDQDGAPNGLGIREKESGNPLWFLYKKADGTRGLDELPDGAEYRNLYLDADLPAITGFTQTPDAGGAPC